MAIIEATPGVVETPNEFNLDNSTVSFMPSNGAASAYRYAVAGAGYDASAASQGSPMVALGDDDSRQVVLPFAFPFFGTTYRTIFLNSDGNLTFTAADPSAAAAPPDE